MDCSEGSKAKAGIRTGARTRGGHGIHSPSFLWLMYIYTNVFLIYNDYKPLKTFANAADLILLQK